jgi:GNAT superfamily N-acetyltransferase
MRIAESADIAALTRLINTAFEVERFFLDNDRLDAAEVERRLALGKFLLEEDGEKLAGCVYVELRGERAYIGLLSVDPSRQRTGLGRKLMAAAETFAQENGCKFVDLQIVSVRQELPGFYHSLGFVETGTGPFPENVHTRIPCHFVIMSKSLPRLMPHGCEQGLLARSASEIERHGH